MNGRVVDWVDGQMDAWMKNDWLGGRIDGWIDGRMDEEWMNK